MSGKVTASSRAEPRTNRLYGTTETLRLDSIKRTHERDCPTHLRSCNARVQHQACVCTASELRTRRSSNLRRPVRSQFVQSHLRYFYWKGGALHAHRFARADG